MDGWWKARTQGQSDTNQPFSAAKPKDTAERAYNRVANTSPQRAQPLGSPLATCTTPPNRQRTEGRIARQSPGPLERLGLYVHLQLRSQYLTDPRDGLILGLWLAGNVQLSQEFFQVGLLQVLLEGA